MDPESCDGEEDRFLGWSARHGKSLFPIGELDGTFFLGVDQDGVIYLVVDRVARIGVLEEGVEALIRGVMVEQSSRLSA
ncbi:SUKH-3 domain-containing protein [Actinosynnema sp. NPDC051121]